MGYRSWLALWTLGLGLSSVAQSQDRYALTTDGIHLTMSAGLGGAGRSGILVEEVSHGYLGLLPGDVIASAAGVPVGDAQHLVGILKSRNPAPVDLQVDRAGKTIRLQVRAADYRALIPPDPPAPPALPPPPPPPIGQ